MRYLTHIVILIARFAYYLLSLDPATPAAYAGRHRDGEVERVYCTYHPDDLRPMHAAVPDKELWRFRMLYTLSGTPSVFTVPVKPMLARAERQRLIATGAITASDLPSRTGVLL